MTSEMAPGMHPGYPEKATEEDSFGRFVLFTVVETH